MRGRNQLNRPINIADLQVLAQQEETREVTAEEIEKSLIPESLKQHKYSIKLWIEFSQQVLGTHVQEDKPFPQPPPANHIRLFLTWYTRTSNGLIDEKINDTTIANRLRCLKRAIRLFTNHIYSKADNSLFAQAVENELPRTESLSTKAYDKPLAPLNVSKDVIRFLWVCDEYQFQHPRARLQLAFSILMLTLMGMRPGEFIESSNWKDSNEGLLYRDVKLLRSSEADGGFMLHVQLRNRKGHRHNHKQGALMLLTEEPGDRALCPVTYFLALALADGVFEGCKTLSDLQSRKPSPGSSYCEFPYHADLGNLPVLRCCQPDGSISPTRILTYYGFHWMIRSLGQRAGYKDKLTSYCFRRGYGNAIDKIVTAAQRQQLMGHANPNIFQTYISSMIGIDSQSVVLGRDQRMDLINNHSSMMLHRNLLAPMPPGSQLAETSSLNTCHHDSDLPYDKRKYLQRTTFEEERQQFFQCRSTATSSTSSDGTRTPSRYLKALLKFEVGRYQAVMLMYPDLKSDGDEHDKDNETLDHESCETAEMTTSTHHCVTLEQIVHPLQSIANAHKQNFEYEGAETIENGCCSFCKKTLDGERRDRANFHLLLCARERRLRDGEARMTSLFAKTRLCRWNDCHYRFEGNAEKCSRHVTNHLVGIESSQCLWVRCRESYDSHEALSCHVTEKHGAPDAWTKLTDIRYCFEHNLWCCSTVQWEKHLERSHLPQLSDFCGLIRKNGAILVAGNCLFCIGNTEECLTSRFWQFFDAHSLRRHVENHLKNALYPFKCPHPSCSTDLHTADLFWKHAVSVHGIPPLHGTKITGKRKSPCEDDPQQE